MSPFDWSAFAGVLPYTALAVVAVLGTTFAVAARGGRHAVVDVAWGLGFVAIAAVSFVVSGAAGEGDDLRRVLLLVLTAVWGGRLAWHIWQRSRGKGEDPRYEELMSKAPGNPQLYALRKIYLTQGLAMWFISLPVQVGAFEARGLTWLIWVGVAVWAVGLFFETVGDWQLDRFRNDPANKGEVLDTGLWRYTRHPNYFGDACVWWGLSLITFSAWPGILFILSPVLMTWTLAKGTGAALLEKDIEDRRPGYAEYVRRTSGFVPLPPKPPKSSSDR
jgi:steroid 5-alpha reductase family enzyme